MTKATRRTGCITVSLIYVAADIGSLRHSAREIDDLKGLQNLRHIARVTATRWVADVTG
jgi:hypothetical protein